MIDRSTVIVAPLARWSSRIAVFSASLLIVAVALHRLTSFPTQLAVNLFAVGAAGAGLAMLGALVALVQILLPGLAGASTAGLRILLSTLLPGLPLTYHAAFLK